MGGSQVSLQTAVVPVASFHLASDISFRVELLSERNLQTLEDEPVRLVSGDAEVLFALGLGSSASSYRLGLPYRHEQLLFCPARPSSEL